MLLKNFTASILIHLDFLSILIEEIHDRNSFCCFNPYSPGFSIYLKNKRRKCRCKRKLQSLFTWIFYLFDDTYIDYWGDRLLQSLFTWIFYLFLFHDLQLLSNLLASILIHLDFLSI